MARKPRKDANIDQRGERSWRIRYTCDGKRYSVTVKGSKGDARTKWNEIKTKIDRGAHLPPSAVTFSEWVPQYLALVEAKRRNARTAEGYGHKLKYALAAFGDRPLQKLRAGDIDQLTTGLKDKVSERTRRHVFVVTKACLAAAQRKGLIERNPADNAEGVDVDDPDVGETLPSEAFADFLAGFAGHPLENIVTVALRTGARRNEILAIRHSDVDYAASVLKINRAVERTTAYGTRFKLPKSGKAREIAIDSELLDLFRREREKLARIIADVAADAPVNLSLVKIPDDALVFYATPRGGPLRFDRPRDGAEVSKQFRRQATKLGRPRLRFHDLRGSHETALLDAGVPVHVVAARCGHSPAMLLKAYAERTQSADAKAASALERIFNG